MDSSTEDIQDKFKVLNEQFNTLMSPENYNGKDEKVLTILKEMLWKLITKNHIIHAESIINNQLLLTNLHRALTDSEQFRVISVENVRNLDDPFSHFMEFAFIPAEEEKSLQRFTLNDTPYMDYRDPIETIGEIQKWFWPMVANENQRAEHRLALYICGKEQDSRFSLYQGLLYQYWREDNDFDINTKLWPDRQTITYRRLKSNFGQEFSEDFSELKKESWIILRFLDELYHLIGKGCTEVFVNDGLDGKLNMQLDDRFVTKPKYLPPWWIYLMNMYPFLFRYQTRIRFFKLVAYSHPNPAFLESMAVETPLPEKTYFVSRDHIMKYAKQLMDEHAGEDRELRVRFHDEIGIGIGPTSEFYTLVSKGFEECELMWRRDKSFGLFPCPRLASSIEEVKSKFVLLGQMVGKAIHNGKLLDIHFCKPFYKLILGKDLLIDDIRCFEPHLGKILVEFKEIVSKLTDKGGSVEELCLSFVLPGYEEFSSEYKRDVPVNLTNLEDYVTFVKDGTIGSGIRVQMEAFKKGFKQVFRGGLFPTAVQAFSIFTEEEFEATLCGQAENSWSLEELNEHISIGGGYTAESVPIVNLFEILEGFNLEQRRGFLQFVTGTPRLPYGGLASLKPNLIVVKILVPEESLPCATTCDNRLSLPPYLSKDTLQEKLLYAITEGQGSFGFV